MTSKNEEQAAADIRFGRDRLLVQEHALERALYDLALRVESLHGDPKISVEGAIRVLRRVESLRETWQSEQEQMLADHERALTERAARRD